MKMQFVCIALVLFFELIYLPASAQHEQQSSFTVVPLCVYGGNNESNLSTYMIGVSGSDIYMFVWM